MRSVGKQVDVELLAVRPSSLYYTYERMYMNGCRSLSLPSLRPLFEVLKRGSLRAPIPLLCILASSSPIPSSFLVVKHGLQEIFVQDRRVGGGRQHQWHPDC